MLCADLRGPGIIVKTILTIIITIIIKNKKMLKISYQLQELDTWTLDKTESKQIQLDLCRDGKCNSVKGGFKKKCGIFHKNL